MARGLLSWASPRGLPNARGAALGKHRARVQTVVGSVVVAAYWEGAGGARALVVGRDLGLEGPVPGALGTWGGGPNGNFEPGAAPTANAGEGKPTRMEDPDWVRYGGLSC